MTTITPDATERVREVTEEIQEATLKAGRAYIDASNSVLESIAGYQDELKGNVSQQWLADVIEKQAEVTRQLIKFNADQRERLDQANGS
jgi:hypothetical protein